MLRVPTYVAPSRIAGVGLFSAMDLPAGTILWEFTEGVDWRMTAGELERFPEPFRSRLRHYVYMEDSGLLVLCGDNARFMNHSDAPNCDDSDARFTITSVHVPRGEELTCDYALFDLTSKRAGVSFADRPAAVAESP